MKVGDRVQRLRIAEKIPVGQHHALRNSRCSAGVDDGGGVVRPDLGDRFFERFRVGRVRFPAAVHDRGKGLECRRSVRVKADKMPDLGKPRPDRLDFCPKIGRRTDNNFSLGIVDDISNLFRSQRWIDRNGHPSGSEHGKVRHDPIRPVFGKEGKLVSRGESHRPKAEGDEPDAVVKFPGGHRDVLPVLLIQKQVGLLVEMERIQGNLAQRLDHSVPPLQNKIQRRPDGSYIAHPPPLNNGSCVFDPPLTNFRPAA